MPARDVPLAPDVPRDDAARRVRGWPLLGALLGGPVAWVLHLNGAYVIVALWCAERWRGTGAAIAVLTALCLLACVGAAYLAVRLWRAGQHARTADREPGHAESWDGRMGERGARGAFLAVIALFMAALFAYLIVLQGLPPIFTPLCQPGRVG